MYCNQCQQELDSNAAFCKNCGTPNPQVNKVGKNSFNEVESAVEEPEKNSPQAAPEISLNDQKKIAKSHKIFHTKDEIFIDSLGVGFIQSFTLYRKAKKSILFLSDRRVYQMGKMLEKNKAGDWEYSNGESFLNLREITGAHFAITNNTSRLGRAFFLIFLGLFLFILFGSAEGKINRDVFPFFMLASVFIIIIGIIKLIWSQAKKKKYFIIESSGGCIATECNWYSRNSIRRFMRNLSKQKDNVFAENKK